MKISVSPYTLNFRVSKSGGRSGALLRRDFGDGQYGYADCHPWPELGDAPLAEQLRLLADNVFTPLTLQSIEFSVIDAAARSGKLNLFTGLSIPSSHYLVVDVHTDTTAEVLQAAQEGFQAIKVKVGREPTNEIPVLLHWMRMLRPYRCKLRLDFNGLLSEKQFLDYLRKCEDGKDVVDFFEDPFPYNPERWWACRENHGIRLACDKDSLRALGDPHACDVLVLKPAIQDVIPFLSPGNNRQLVFTSYLDHPLGQLTAAFVAAKAKKVMGEAVGICGLLSHVVYQDNPFVQQLNQMGPSLAYPQGTGFGFDQLLKELPWTPLT